jgi:sugar fermentation stimulation protein A
MRWEIAPVEVVFQKRYKRFFADIEVQGKTEVAHVPNTGSLKSCLFPGAKALVLPSTNPERKLKWTLVALASPGGGWVGVDTSQPNKMLKKVAEEKLFDPWRGYEAFQHEVKINAQTRLDGCFSKGKKKVFVEVKNVTLATGDFESGKGTACFPDSVTERGQKHLREMMDLMEEGHECELIFAVQRTDCTAFAPADDIDPIYGQLLREAIRKGLRVSPWVLEVGPKGIQFTGQVLPIEV